MSFFEDMSPYAAQASQNTGVPAPVILAQWALESNYGQSDLAQRADNLAGITFAGSSSIADGTTNGYAQYKDYSQFVQDYTRVMNLPYYDNVRNAGSVEGAIQALSNSPWAESHYDGGQALADIINQNGLANINYSAPSTSGSGVDQKKNNGDSVVAAGDSVSDGGLDMKLDGTNIVSWNGSMGQTLLGGIVLDGITYVPVRSVAKVEGKQVDYDDESKTVLVR